MKKHLPNLLLCLASVVVFFAALETALALFWPHKIIIQTYHEQYHPVMGWVNKPNADGNFYFNRTTFFHRRHNEHGLRSLRDIPYEKPAGVKRVVLVGDSFFWGYGVNDGDVLSENLQQLAGPQVEIVNGAVSGYGTDQELLWLTEEGLKYEPDVVVLGLFPGNDWDEITHSVMYGYPKPFFSLEGGQLALHNVPVPDTRETRRKAFEEPDSAFGKLKKFFRHHTHSYPFIAGRLNSLPGVRKFLLRMGFEDEFTGALPGIPNLTFTGKVRPLFEAMVKEMKTVSNETGADFLLVHIPEKENTPGAPAKYEGIIGEGDKRNTTNSRYLSAFAATAGIPFLDLLPIVRERQMHGEVLYTPGAYDHHWTPAGHRMAAASLHGRLAAREAGAGR